MSAIPKPKTESTNIGGSHRARGHSLERELRCLFALIFIFVSVLFVFLVHYSGMSTKVAVTLYALFAIVFVPYLMRTYRRIVQPMQNLSSIVEAIRQEDYSLSPGITYPKGVMAELLLETRQLVSVLQTRKERYNQQIYLIYRLIEQLDLPVLVLNEELRLSHGNEAFSQWYGQPWKTVRGLSSHKLGLIHGDTDNWQFADPKAHKDWQIRHSQFVHQKHTHHLLILNNISSEVSQVQQDAWQQIIRVLSHEIRNSLTPICSMTDMMLDMPELNDNLRTPLQVIESRSENLLQFVERYADTAKPININKKPLQSEKIVNKIVPLFPDNSIQVEGTGITLQADPVLLEQVLINLLRNGLEAQQANQVSDPVKLRFFTKGAKTCIEIKDSGIGIANPDNLFVPFYTTKESGQGIGLTLCRRIIEQHGGTLQLANHPNGGAVATIIIKDIN